MRNEITINDISNYIKLIKESKLQTFENDVDIMKKINENLINKFSKWIGNENLRYFKHLNGLTGTYAPVLKLNQKRKGIPVHPVHLREGMQIRNWMRQQKECNGWNDIDFDDNWCNLVELTIKKKIK